MSQFAYYQAIGIGKHIQHDNETLRQLRKKLQNISPYQLYYENRKYIILLFNLDSPKATITLRTLENLSKDLTIIILSSVV